MPLSTPVASGPVCAELARSWLLVNATRIEEFDAAHASDADQIVLDIEDAVIPALKPAARTDVARWLEHGTAWVRINDCTTSFWSDDIDELKDLPGLAGVMLAKTETAQHVTDTFERLGGTTPVLALVESALGIEEATRIASARGAFRLAFGSGDYRRDTGASADDLAMSYPRSRLVVASRIGSLPGAIDGPTLGNNRRALQKQAAMAVGLGLTGKLCLDASQAPVINESVTPSPAEITWATTFLADFESRGRTVRDGSDLPQLIRAHKIARLSAEFGTGLE
jgi:citrate lyase subunit beta/citryl-CoA lyase